MPYVNIKVTREGTAPGASATTICWQRSSSRNVANAHSITVRPASGMYCLGFAWLDVPWPNRRPLPAAGRTSR